MAGLTLKVWFSNTRRRSTPHQRVRCPLLLHWRGAGYVVARRHCGAGREGVHPHGSIAPCRCPCRSPLFRQRALPFETSAPGVFAVGDVRLGSMKRVAPRLGRGRARFVPSTSTSPCIPDPSSHDPQRRLRPSSGVVDWGRISAVVCSVERRGIADGDEQAFRTQQSGGDLGPRLRTGLVDEPIALGFELGACSGDVRDLELDAGLGDRDVGGPFGSAETGPRGFRKGPQARSVSSLPAGG